jgi:4-amino-4-deoxy-L-arabinose transferase-like glycosyltransferase
LLRPLPFAPYFCDTHHHRLMNISLTRTQWVLIVTLALVLAPYFIRLGASSLWDSNEAFYAEAPREMIESHDYVNPTFNYRPRLNKPPLSYWLVVPFYKLLGTSEAAERLPIVLAALIMVATAYGLGRVVFSTNAGVLAAIGLAAAPRFLMFSRRIMIDVYLAMFMALALLMFLLAEKWPERRRLYLILMYALIGLGVMTKGPVAVALPAAALVIYLAVYRRLHKLREMMLPMGVIVVAAIVLPWYLAIYFQHGWSHIETFILEDNLSRYAQQVWGPRRGFLFYIPVMIGDFFPWSLFLIPSLLFAARAVWPANRQPASSPNASVLLGIWIVVIVAFFSFSRSKEDLYILPIYPAAAALVGGALVSFFSGAQSRQRGSMRWTTLALAAVISASGAVILYLFGKGTQPYELAGSTVIGCTAVFGGLLAAGATLLDRQRSAILTTALAVAACNWVFVLWTLPDFERYKPVRSLCEVIASNAGPDALVGYFRASYPSMVFYLRRPIFDYVAVGDPTAARIYEQQQIKAAFSSGKEVFCVMTAGEYEAIKPELPAQTRVLASHPIFKVKLKGILDRIELPQVVLISNKGEINITQ